MAKKRKQLPAAMKRALAQGAQLPQAGELIAHFLALSGGPQRLAKMMLEEFHAAKAGSIIRQRILDMILRLTAAVNAEMGGLDDLDLLTDADLERELTTLLGQLPDGAEEETAPPT